MECLALPSIEGVVVLDNKVRVVHEAVEVCILWVSGQVSNISEVVTWMGGYICPKHNELAQYTLMNTMAAGNTDGDIIVVLSDELYDEHELFATIVTPKLMEWGIECE